MPRRRNETAAPVAETVAIAADWNRWSRLKMIRQFEIGSPREMYVEHRNQRRGLREFKAQLTSDANAHNVSIVFARGAAKARASVY